jgi:hypothetical protein
MKTPRKRNVSKARFDLPPAMAREVGRIIVTWSFLEYILQKTVWDLAGVDEVVGRLAVREPRVTDRLGLICDLAEVRGIAIPAQSIKDLRKMLERNGLIRDLLAHGAWTHDPERGWMVIRARGSYDFQPADHSKNRKVDPEALRATSDDLRGLREGIERCVESVRSLARFVNAQLSSSGDKPPEQPS